MKTAAVLLVLTFAACDAPPDDDAGGAAAAAAGATHAQAASDGAAAADTTQMSGTDAPPPACTLEQGCAACLAPGPTGPGFQLAGQCEAIIACRRAGGVGPDDQVPWQSCINLHGASADFGGIACAQHVAATCQ